MKTVIAAGVIIFFGAAIAYQRHGTIASLQEQNQSLIERTRQIAELKNQNLLLRECAIDSNELQRLRAERVDLMKLRAQVSELRHWAGKSPQQMAAAIQTTRGQAETEQKKADFLEAQEKAKLLSEKTMASISGFNSVIHQLAKTNGEFPNSLEQANQWAQSTRFRDYFDQMMTNGSEETIPLSAFEFLPREEPLKFVDSHPTLSLRERQPRAQPDGGWKRAYAYSDRQTIEIALPDANFDAWEREHLTNKP